MMLVESLKLSCYSIYDSISSSTQRRFIYQDCHVGNLQQRFKIVVFDREIRKLAQMIQLHRVINDFTSGKETCVLVNQVILKLFDAKVIQHKFGKILMHIAKKQQFE